MRKRLLAALMALTWLLTACGGGTGNSAGATLPPVTPAASPRTSATASASPTVSVPPDATLATTAGLSAFIRYFYASLQRAYDARDATFVRGLSTADCRTCLRVADSVERLQRDGLVVHNYRVDVADVVAPGGPYTGPVTVTAVVSFSDYVEQKVDGTVVYREPASRITQNVTLRRDGQSWRVADVSGS